MTKEQITLLCVSCPKGCVLTVDKEGDNIAHVEAGCKRGVVYAKQELSDPRRMVATSIRVNNGLLPVVPVYTAAPFPKKEIFKLLAIIREKIVTAPIKKGDILIENALGYEINIIASRDMPVLASQ